jgi:curved DNA-binding protein CbpA
MTYYEELGVTPKASQEEIRRAFRNASRLLHPDLQQDPGLRQLAEMQMRRLNEVVETLCDEARRAEYDANAEGRWRVAPPVRKLPLSTPGRIPLAAILAGLLLGCLLMLCWSIIATPPREIASSGSNVVAGAPPPAPSSKAALPQKNSPARSPSGYSTYAQPAPYANPLPGPATANEVAPALNNPPPLAATPESPVHSRSGADSHSTKFSEPAATSTGAAVSSMQTASRASSLAGIWLYVPDPTDRPERGEYQAEYIELRIQERGGQLLGSFRSRYRIPDRPINPSVSFRFQGPVEATQFQWEGPGGATGTVKLKLKSQLSLDADWQAQAVGSQLGLAAGVATLIRRME